MSCLKEPKSEDLNLTDIQKESLKEKIFRILAVLTIILFPIALIMCFRVVKQYKRAIILRFGRVRADSPAGPGVIWVLPLTDTVFLVDLRTQSLNLPPQEILTKDSVTVQVDAIVYFHVLKPLNCVLNVQAHKYSTEMIAVATLRNILGQHVLTDVLTNRVKISHVAKDEIFKVTSEWGVAIERVEIKDVILPFELQKAMAAEAEGTRLAKAKIIEAKGEIKAADNLKQASRIMMENPQVMLHLSRQRLYSFHFLWRFLLLMGHMQVRLMGHNSLFEISEDQQPNKNKRTSTDDPSQINSPGQKDDLLEITPEKDPSKSDDNFRARMQSRKGDDRCIEKFITFMSYLIVVITFPISLFVIFMAVRQFERAVILRNGRVYKNKTFGPGLIFHLPCVDVVNFTDLRIICYAVPPQEALTKDALTITVDAVILYKIRDPVWAVINVTDYKTSTQFLAATTLRNSIGSKKLSEILMDRLGIGTLVTQQMKLFVREWGIQIVRVEIKDISLPLQLQKAMAAEAESSRLANAKIIVANSEIEATKNLQKATTMLMDNPLCMQLRYLQSLHTIAGDKTHTIVVPFSIDILKKIFK